MNTQTRIIYSRKQPINPMPKVKSYNPNESHLLSSPIERNLDSYPRTNGISCCINGKTQILVG